MGLRTCPHDEPLQHRHPRTEDTVPTQFLTGLLKEQRRPVVFESPLQEPGSDEVEVHRRGPSEAQVMQDLLQMLLARAHPRPVRFEIDQRGMQLIGDEANGLVRCRRQVVRHEAEQAERRKLERAAEAIVVSAQAAEERVVLLAEGEERDEVALR